MQNDENSRGIIDPATTTLNRPRPAERMLLFPLEAHLEAWLARVGADRGSRKRWMPAWYHAPTRSGGPGALGPFLGAPAAAGLTEELIAAGARELVFFGIAGSLRPEFRIGECVVAQAAFADDGVSKHYLPGQEIVTPDETLSMKVVDHLGAHDIAARRATIWTTDAVYRETPEKVRLHAEAGRDLVEMEISALCSIAAFRKVSLAAVLVVSDELFTGRWKHGFLSPRYRLAVARVIKALAQW